MVAAEDDPVGGEIVGRAVEGVPQRDGRITRRVEDTALAFQFVERGLPLVVGKALRDRHCKRQPRQFIEQAGPGGGRIFLDREAGPVCSILRRRTPQLEGFPCKERPLGEQVGVYRAGR